MVPSEIVSDVTQCGNVVPSDPRDDGISDLAGGFPTQVASVQGTCHEQRCALPPVELPLRDSQGIGDVPERASQRAHTEETCSDSRRPHGVKGGGDEVRKESQNDPEIPTVTLWALGVIDTGGVAVISYRLTMVESLCLPCPVQPCIDVFE